MTTARQLAANRKNARRSTGPSSAAGKARASQNARRYGFAVPVWSITALASEAEALARDIAGIGASPTRLELARRVAEAHIDLVRVRTARRDLIAPGLSHASWDPLNHERLRSLRPYDRLRLQHGPPTADKLALVLSDAAPTLAAIDRYERRALSRRKFAIRDFDKMQRA